MPDFPTGDVDPAAQALAARLGGEASRRIDGFGNREFDAVSDDYVAQTTSAASAVTQPHNFLTRARREQIRATLAAARQGGKAAYFEFTAGEPHQEVKNFITRNAARVGVGCRIVFPDQELSE